MGFFDKISSAATRVEMGVDKARSKDRTSKDSKEKGAFRAGSIIEGNDLIVDFRGREAGDSAKIKMAETASEVHEEASSKYFDASSREARIADALASLSGGKDVTPASAEELSQLADDLENADDVDFRALQLDALRRAADKQKAEEQKFSERGAKPERSYDHEKKLRDKSEELQKEALAYAVEIAALMPDNPKDITKDILRQASGLARRFSVREGDSLRELQKLKDAMVQRFPGEADKYNKKFETLLETYRGPKEAVSSAIEDANNQRLEGDAQREAVNDVVEGLNILNEINLSTEDINASLLEGGITINVESGEISIEAGSSAEKYLEQKAKIDFLVEVYAKTLKVAEVQPEVADKLLVLVKTIQAEQNILRQLESTLRTSVLDKAAEQKQANIDKKAEELQREADAKKAKEAADAKALKAKQDRDKRKARINKGIGVVRKVADFFTNLADGAEKARDEWESKKRGETLEEHATETDTQTEVQLDASSNLSQLEQDLADGKVTAEDIRRILANAEAEE